MTTANSIRLDVERVGQVNGVVVVRHPNALAVQGAWAPGSVTAGPRGPYGHTCTGDYKTIGYLGDKPWGAHMAPHE